MKSRRLISLAAALLLLLTACGGKGSSDQAKGGGPATTSAAGHPSAGADNQSGGGTSQPISGEGSENKYTTANPPSEKFRPPDDTSGQPGTLPLEVRITPSCVEWGGTVKFELKTKPGADYGMQVKWPNEQFSNLESSSGKVDKEGTATWSVNVKPTALTGEAHLQVAVILASSSGRGSDGDFRFLVGRPGRC